MEELSDLALDVASSAGAGYADVRIVERTTESLSLPASAVSLLPVVGTPVQ